LYLFIGVICDILLMPGDLFGFVTATCIDRELFKAMINLEVCANASHAEY